MARLPRSQRDWSLVPDRVQAGCALHFTSAPQEDWAPAVVLRSPQAGLGSTAGQAGRLMGTHLRSPPRPLALTASNSKVGGPKSVSFGEPESNLKEACVVSFRDYKSLHHETLNPLVL